MKATVKDNRVFKRTEVDPNRRPGWVADLSPADVVNPDCYWYFATRKAALEFVALVDGGMDAQEAAYRVALPHAPGTKPDTSLWLGEDRKHWLAEHGGIQPTIQRLIDEAMLGD